MDRKYPATIQHGPRRPASIISCIRTLGRHPFWGVVVIFFRATPDDAATYDRTSVQLDRKCGKTRCCLQGEAGLERKLRRLETVAGLEKSDPLSTHLQNGLKRMGKFVPAVFTKAIDKGLLRLFPVGQCFSHCLVPLLRQGKKTSPTVGA